MLDADEAGRPTATPISFSERRNGSGLSAHVPRDAILIGAAVQPELVAISTIGTRRAHPE